jgi:hypothetical protein
MGFVSQQIPSTIPNPNFFVAQNNILVDEEWNPCLADWLYLQMDQLRQTQRVGSVLSGGWHHRYRILPHSLAKKLITEGAC